MATLAHIANFTLSYATTDSPPSYTTIEEVTNVSALGARGEYLDVTNFSSTGGVKEFIAALAEGNDVTIECNDINGAQQRAIIAAKGTNKFFRGRWLGTSPNRTFRFVGAISGYEFAPSVNDANKLNLFVKISTIL